MFTPLSPSWVSKLGLALSVVWMTAACHGEAVDVAPFGLPLPEGSGLMWEDPREIHEVTVRFKAAPPTGLRLEYWGSRWPQQRLPKDREPGGGDVGWMELGNWHTGNWRPADTETRVEGALVRFTFRPVNAKEFPTEKDYPATFRYTLKLRLAADSPVPAPERIQVMTDSVWTPRVARIVWAKAPVSKPRFEAFNGAIERVEEEAATTWRVLVKAALNADPNTFDRTLVTVRAPEAAFTFGVDDLARGPLYLPQWGVAVLADSDARDYASVAAEQNKLAGQSLYDRVGRLPEHTWKAAWAGMPAKKSRICFPLGLDGGRQRFRLDANGGVAFRSNDHYLRGRPGEDTARLDWESAPVQLGFGLPAQPVDRTLEENAIPICVTTWEADGVRIQQTAFVSALTGTQAAGPVPAADTLTVFMADFSFTNLTAETRPAKLSMPLTTGDVTARDWRVDAEGFLWVGQRLRGQFTGPVLPTVSQGKLAWTQSLAPGGTARLGLKLPYLLLEGGKEQAILGGLDFNRERVAVADYWRRRMDESAHLITPEPMLNEFYRAHANHLLVNCEREPASTRRFARVGSFSYGAYGNESCMMVEDLERRGYHREAQECLEAWLHYQGTVKLPGDFASQEGTLYGAGGYESGGYNQHHGWILWSLAQHYRFTRDTAWLAQAAPGILKGADWIIRETARTQTRHPLERGLLPAGSLEDIGDWWTWLSTSCYTWRGLDAAAWALEQAGHAEAARVRREADAYHAALLRNIRAAAERSPVVRLRDGTAVPHFPSQLHRRGRSFGWICETLEGALHLLITRALDARSPEAAWIAKDYEDNLYLSNQYGYLVEDFDKNWFSRGGMSMQACLLLDVEPYLYRDDVPQALRALFNGLAVSYFPDVRMNTEHALPEMGDWRGDHFKSSDESNVAGWLRYLFVREESDRLLVGQAIPRVWLAPGQRCGIERTATWFGPVSVVYTADANRLVAQLEGPQRNPPKTLQVRFRDPQARPIRAVMVDGQPWRQFTDDWVELPGNIGKATVEARF